MSLILEALRKSEQQRRAGEPPTLISESVWASRRMRLGGRRESRARWALLLPLLALALAAGWWFGGRGAPAPPADTAHRAPARSQPAAAAPAPLAATPTSGAVASAARPAAAASRPLPTGATATAARAAGSAPVAEAAPQPFANSPDLLTPKPPTSEVPYVPPEAALPQPLADDGTAPATPAAPTDIAPLDTRPPGTATATPAPGAGTSSAPTLAPPDAVAASTAVPAPASAAGTVPMVYELPLPMRQALPPIKLTMHVYAADPAQRFVIVDGKRVNPGGPIDNDLNLIDILPDGVVLEFRGQRFMLPRARY
jgi:general secretion pathway protein B